MTDELPNTSSNPMRCFYPRCTVSPRTGGALFRINEKGVPGIWACREHMKQTDATPIPKDVDQIVRAIEGDKR